MIFYLAHKKKEGWLVLGYEASEPRLARQQATSAHPDSLQIRVLGKADGYPHPLSDDAVILAESLMNTFVK